MSDSDPYAAFASALLDPTRPVPPGLTTCNGSDPGTRFAVYRNNVLHALGSALEETYPVTRMLVGETFFAALAASYARARPPRSALLLEHARGLPAFIAGFPPARDLPWLGAMAELELARVMASRAADAAPLSARDLATRLEYPERLARSSLALHPSVRLFAAPWGILSLWAAHQGRGRVADVDVHMPEAALVLRAGEPVLVVPIPHAAVPVARRLIDGAPIGCALAEHDPPRLLTDLLTLLIRHDAIVDWRTSGASNL